MTKIHTWNWAQNASSDCTWRLITCKIQPSRVGRSLESQSFSRSWSRCSTMKSSYCISRGLFGAKCGQFESLYTLARDVCQSVIISPTIHAGSIHSHFITTHTIYHPAQTVREPVNEYTHGLADSSPSGYIRDHLRNGARDPPPHWFLLVWIKLN
jgi:hypothetical protein